MQRYLVKLMFNINIDNGNHAHQFDEQIRIVEANTLDTAFQKARIIGKKEEETFINKENKIVNWQFIDVTDVYELESLKDGEQVYSTTHENAERHSFINYVRQKAMLIQAKSLTFA
ncbi:MAG: DUF4288 domain-containing protein [Bacteroidia bacterium]|nr:DUF4288 domain-containing protein [Bacteroidia bacterium]